jgi:transcriptional regulator with XRE-family HTH domain
MNGDQGDKILKELETLRKLKIFELSQQGYSQDQLAEAIGVSQATISRMLPKNQKKKPKPDES